ncbi:MAG TPA: hypothetical protein VJI75_02130 [Candidatus Nanoarchaeia archaeon]|nr:hypothetical protein [Candidatus Nanoarchaeia archaeon]
MTQEEMVRKIILERLKAMAPNVKIALGSKGEFLDRDALMKEVQNSTQVGKKIVEIQMRYLRALKEGIV